jgi:hypothetical protein
MKLKIVSDGKIENTQIVNAETNEVLEDVINLEISMDAFHIEAAFLVNNPQLSIEGIEAQEVQVNDTPIQYDGTTSNTDN